MSFPIDDYSTQENYLRGTLQAMERESKFHVEEIRKDQLPRKDHVETWTKVEKIVKKIFKTA